MKIEIVLILYDFLMSGEYIARHAFCARYKISERTFYRYLREVGDFLRVHKSDYVVDISREGTEYFIKKRQLK